MDLDDAMRRTPGVRDFQDSPVAADILAQVLDAARFAPSGLNRQPWRVVAVADLDQRRRVGALFAASWDALVAERVASGAIAADDPVLAAGTRFAHRFADVPLMLAVWANTVAIDVTDEATQVPSIVAGGSIFPFVQNVLLACRSHGLATRLTTLLAREPERLRVILDVPAGYSLACVIAIGYPRQWPKRLSRRPVSSFATWDSFDGPPIEAAEDAALD